MKKKRILLFLSLIYCGLVYSQKVVFLEKNDTIEKPKYQNFIFISDSTDISESKYVAKIKSIGSLKNVINLYLIIKHEAQKIGANSFKIESFNKIDSENGELILSAYYNEDEGDFFYNNFLKLPKNKIYIFGNPNLLENNSQSYKIRNDKFEIANGKFKDFDIKIGEEVKVNKGGFTGMTLFITGKEKGFCTFLSFSGIGINGASYNPYGGGVGINFTTGKIDKIEMNLALALLKIYTAQN